ncbi:MAG: cell division protein FtsK, partial [Alphaproteobacteria bacterium]|nr:cell division protein FtsK [Alphaproteobacteria bacterium]
MSYSSRWRWPPRTRWCSGEWFGLGRDLRPGPGKGHLMAHVARTAGRRPATWQGLKDFVRLRLVELRGLAWVGAALALAGTLASFHAADPSFNRATVGEAANLFGRPGAYIADVLLQSFGLASALLVAALAVWGARIVMHREPPVVWLRLCLLPSGLAVAAMALAALPVPSWWPIASGFGGAAGLLGLDAILRTVGLDGAMWAAALAGGAFGAAAVAILAQPLALGRAQFAALGAAAARGTAWLARTALSLVRRRKDLFGAAVDLAEALKRTERRLDGEPSVSDEPRLADDDDDDAADEAEDEAEDTPRARTGPVVGTRAVVPKKRPPKQSSLALSNAERELPALNLLQAAPEGGKGKSVDQDSLAQNAKLLESVLQDFGVNGEVTKVWPGPVVTLYELEPAPGTRTSRVISLADDIARSMSAVSARVAVIPGRNVVGIELPNANRERVYLSELVATETFERGGNLALALGKDIGGTPVMADLSRMPHLLIAGT